MSVRLDADVVVAGAGPAGAAAALLAAESGRRVVIFDKAQFPRDKACGEGLMPPGCAMLGRLGVEDQVRSIGAPPLNGISFGLRDREPADLPFPPHPSGERGLGVRRLQFDALLVDRLEQHPQISFQPGITVSRVLPSNGAGPGMMTSAGEIRARFVVVADGLRSALRHGLGWTIGPRPPHRYGIIGHWQTARSLDPWVRITADRGLEIYDGPVGPEERLVALLCSRSRMAEFAGTLTQRYRQVVLELRPQMALGSALGPARAIGPFNYRARTVAQRGIFLVGDAAGFVDPISGEGLATGMRQALAFSTAIGQPDAERSYRLEHRRLTSGPRRATALLVHLAGRPRRTERAIRGMNRAPSVMPKLLGMTLGYWGASRLTPREWVALFLGR